MAVWLFVGCGHVAEAPGPNASPSYLEAEVVNVLVGGERTYVWLDAGPDVGVAVGDVVRLPCRSDVGEVTKAFGRRSVADFANGPLPDSRVARIGRQGAVPEPWCDAPAPNHR